MNGSISKILMKSKTLKLKSEVHSRCEKNEMSQEECRGADEYLNKVLDHLEEYHY